MGDTEIKTWSIFCTNTNNYEISRSIFEPIFCSDGSIAHPNLTKLLPTSKGHIVTSTSTQELTNKIIKDDTNTIKLNSLRINNGNSININSPAPSTNNILLTTSLILAQWSAAPSGIPLQIDNTFEIVDSLDTTKKILFNSAGGASTNTTLLSSQTNNVIIALPDIDDTLIGRTTVDILTNKTFTNLIMTSITNGAATLTLPLGPDTLVCRNTTDTLINKTFITPLISTISNTGTIMLPNTTDTLIGRNTTDVLTNKTLTFPIITNILNTNLLTLPTSTDTLIGRSTTDILTNKTLTFPIISSITNTGTITLPTGLNTLIGRNTTDVLTNKTVDGLTVLGDITFDELTNNLVLSIADQATGPATLTMIDLLGVNGDIAISTATQVITNKIITSSTNIIEASQLKTTGTAINTSTNSPSNPDQTLVTTTTTNSTWQSFNRVYPRTTVASGTYAALVTDFFIVITGTTGAIINLPQIAAIGGTDKILYIIKDEGGNASVSNITINRNTVDTFNDGATTSLTINADYGVIRIYSDVGTEWKSW